MSTQSPVLVIDDDRNLLRIAQAQLEQLGFRAEAAGSGEEGLERLRSESFGAVLVDLCMPGMGGEAFVRECASAMPSTPIVVMSAQGDTRDVASCFRNGACDFLVKPWTKAELQSAIDRALQPRLDRRASAEWSGVGADEGAGVRSVGAGIRAVSALLEVAGNDAADQADREPSLLDAVCRALVEEGGHALAWAGYLTQDARRSLRVTVVRGPDAPKPSAFAASWGESSEGLIARAVRAGAPRAIADLAAAPPEASDLPPAWRSRYRSCVALPVMQAGAALAVLALYSEEAGAFDEVAARRLGRMADDLALAIVTVRARARVDASGDRFRRAILAAPFPVMIHAEDGEVLALSDGWTRISGYVHADLPTVERWAQLAHGEKAAEYAERIRSLHRIGNQRKGGEHTIRTARGEERTWSFNSAPLGRTSDGRRLVISMAHDVTERKKAEDALRAGEGRYRILFEERARAEQALQKSRQELSEAQRLARLGVWHWDIGSDAVTWNEELFRIAGLSPSEPAPRYREQSRLFAPESWARLGPARERLLGRGEPYQLELELVRPDGARRWVQSIADAKRDASGAIVALRGTLQDITERKLALAEMTRSQEQARQVAAQLQLILDASHDAIALFDGDLRVLEWNKAAEESFRAPRQLVLGRTLDAFVATAGPDHLKNVDALRAIVDGKDAADRLELSLFRLDGTQFPVEVRARRLQVDGRVLLCAFGRDLTHDRAMEIELRHAQKLEAVGRLASGIAHEINTPIQFIGDSAHFLGDVFEGMLALLGAYGALREQARAAGFAPALLEEVRAAEAAADLDYAREEVPKAVKRTLNGVERVASIVRAMKRFAHHQDGGEKLPADLNAALEETVTVARNEYKYVADVELVLGELPAVPCSIGDLNQVFLNLIVNAAHAIADRVGNGGERGKITVRTAVEDGMALVAVSDTGSGIPEQIRSRIFDPFFTTKAVGRGSGQGLAIARAVVVDRHGGTLTFESEVGAGTTFFVRLPLKPTPAAPAREPSP